MFKNPKTHIESYMFPALFALGMLLGTFMYFILPFEVSVPLSLCMSIFLALIVYLTRHLYKIFLVLFVVCVGFMGLTNAAFQIQNRTPNFLEKQYEDKRSWVIGQVGRSASYNNRDKITLENVKIYGIERDKTPLKVRISSSKGRLSIFNVGDWVAVEAKLSAPKNPRHDKDYNFRRRAWMDEIGATGYVMGQIYKTSWPAGYESKSYQIQKIRNKLTEKIVKNEDDVNSERAVMAALMTGKRTYISPEIYDAYRSSGLAHLLAISGLHIGLIAGFVFFASRRLFGLNEKITLKYNTKVPAAILAVIACLAYTVLAGGTLPTLRACIMASFIFIGFIVGRLHNTLRIFMVTLTLVLLLWPESLLTASFQMSFVAVFSLTLWNEFKENGMHSQLKIIQGMTYTKGVFLTSVVAGLATMPIAAWHFSSIHFVGFVVNVVAIPLTAFIIMPFALLASLFVPFGFEAPFLSVMETGVRYLNSLAIEGASFPHGHYVIEQNEVVVLSLSILLLLLCLYMNKLKKWGVLLLLVTVSYTVLHTEQKNSIYWLNFGETIIEGTGDDAYRLVKSSKSKNEKKLVRYYPLEQIKNEKCDTEGCVIEKNDISMLIMREGSVPRREDCDLVDFVLVNSSNVCTNSLMLPSGSEFGEIIFEEKGVSLTSYSFNENRIWH